MNTDFRMKLLTSTLLIGAVSLATPSLAQTAPAEKAAGDEEVSVVVTGSRIARRDLDSAAPIAVVSAEEFKLTGTVNVEQVINVLPQVVPGTTAFSNNPGGGVATLNLRGIGDTRTLVLVNGRRWLFYDATQVVDLNTIPSFLLEGVDVVTGGASAVYGSDALAGVVNFRLRNNLTGFEVGSQYGITGRGDGGRYEGYVAFGSDIAEGRGHITAYGEYFRRDPVFQGQRGFSTFTQADDGAGGFTAGGSATTPAGRFSTGNTATVNGVALNRGAGTAFAGLGSTYDSSTGSLRPYVSANDIYNFAPVNYLQVPQERYLLGAYADYKISDNVTAYTELSFINNRVDAALASTPVTGAFNVSIAAVSPFLSVADRAQLTQLDANETAINTARTAAGLGPLFTGLAAPANAAGVVQLNINRRTTETGLRVNQDERNAFRVLVGVKGDVGNTGLKYDAYYSYARTRNANVQQGNISRRAFQAGLDGSAPAIDIFGPNALSQTSLNQIAILAQNNDISTLQVATGTVSGNLFDFGLGGGPIGFAVGGEYRSVSARFIPDTALSSGDVIGFNAGNPTQGGYSVNEVFGELHIPIVADRPFIHRLEINGAGRYSDYTLGSVGGVGTYSVQAEWAPIRDITFRGQYQQAVRAPNVGELFGGLQTGFPAVTDPCTTAAALAAGPLRNTCVATGVPAANLGQGIPSALQPNTQIQAQFGGNPNLNAEVSTSYTFGAVIRPTFVPRLSVTVDYFNITIGNAIATAGGGVANILNLCYNTFQDPTNGFCRLITRNQSTGALDGAVNSNGTTAVVFGGAANLSSLSTSGVDLQVNYNQPLAFGLFSSTSKLDFLFNGTWTNNNTFVPVIGQTFQYDCAGRFGLTCGTPQSKWKWSSRLSWLDGPLTTSLRWRHLSAVRDDDDTTAYTIERISAYDLFDLTLSMDVSKNVTMTAGVNNIGDRQPPVLGSNAEQANTYPGVYDVLGRDFFISAKIRF